ncbi:MAG: LacI family DNA-binding transcriptional regulator [Mycobacteriales bacterium]
MSTIVKVAERAGVAVSTVSYVLSGKRPIGAETRRRVLSAIDELGYVPNASARALRSTRTNVLALQGFSALNDESIGQGLFIFAIADAARSRGQDVLLVPAADGIAELTRLSRSSMVDAVMLMGILVRDRRVESLRRLRLPAALLGHPEDDPGVSWIDLDFDAAGRLSVEELVGMGRRSLAYVGPPAEVFAAGAGYAVRTWRGAQAAAAAAGVTLQAQVSITTSALRDQLEQIFAAAPRTDGLVLHFDFAAQQVLRTLRLMGKRVPDDVAVVVVGGWHHQQTESPITFVGSTIDKIAGGAVDLAIEATAAAPPRSILLAPEVRASAP